MSKKRAVKPRGERVIELASCGELELVSSLPLSEVVEARDKYGSNALHWACGSGHLELARYLVETVKLDANGVQLCQKARTPLHFAARNGQLAVCVALVEEWGADPTARAEAGVTPFQLAAWQLREEVVRYLGERADFVDRPNTFACVCSHWVALAPPALTGEAGERQLRVAEYLRRRCGDAIWLARNAQGHRPLHKAAFSGHYVLCNWLRTTFGCIDDVADDHGNYAADLAVEGGHHELARWLRSVAAPTRAEDLRALGLEQECEPELSQVRAAFREIALQTHPDKRGDADQFDRARTAYARLAGFSDAANCNPLRDADKLRAVLAAVNGPYESPPTDFEAKLAVILLEQPNGLSLSQLRKRFLRTWHSDIPNPRLFKCRNLVHLLRTHAHRVIKLEAVSHTNQLLVHSRLDKATATTLLLQQEPDDPPRS